MRIALVTPEFPGCGPSFGVGAYVAVLARALAAAGEEVRVVVCSGDGSFVVDAGAAPRRIAGALGPAALRPWRAGRWLSGELAAWRPDVVEYASWGGLGACDDGGWARVVRLSTPVSAIPVAGPLRRLARPLHARWEAATVRRADLVIADSDAMAVLGAATYGRQADAVIAHAFDGPIAAPPTAAGDALYVGRLEPRKGVDVLLTAWPAVRRARPAARLHLVGRDVDGFGAAALARHGAQGVEVHGWMDDAGLGRLRHLCRVQVVPSRFESFGLVVLEAWAGGQAVVASGAGALPEVVGDAGIIVPVGDAQALAEGIGRVLADPRLSAGLALAGQRRLEERFRPGHCASTTIAAYRDRLARRTG